MPLRDQFHPPVSKTHSWDELHGQWPGEIVRSLTTILPAGYRAAPRVHLGPLFEVDIGSYELDERHPTEEESEGGTTTLVALAPTLTIEADLSDMDEYEVRIYDTERARTLVAAIEIVSPANKDRPRTRDMFATKCAALLQQEVCVSIVDLVSARQANLHVELLARLGRTDPQMGPTPPNLYAVTLRGRKPARGRELLDAWFYPMTVGEPLPTLPIWLGYDQRILLPLETSYQEACRVLGIA
jgi:hypothetical protein